MKISTPKKVVIGLTLIVILVVLLIPTGLPGKIFYRLKREGWLARKADINELKPNAAKEMIALAFGQSNSANFGEARYTPHNRILNYSDGKLYVASDPLVGADGNGGSVWGILGDMLIDSGLFNKVIVIPIGIGNTDVSCWAYSECHDKLVRTLKDLDAHHIKLTHIFWHQGEADSRMATPNPAYDRMLSIVLKTIRDHHQDAPFYCSLASYDPTYAPSTVTSAQATFIKEHSNVLYGPNTDIIIKPGDRYQAVHFSQTGMVKYAHAWFVAIKENKK